MKFPCVSCGACCKVLSKEILESIGLPEAESGGCGHLTESNQCAIYETRPFQCRVDEIAEALSVQKEAFYRDNWDVCIKLSQAVGTEKKLKKEMGEYEV